MRPSHRNILQDRRAIDPVIATIMVVAVTIALAIVTSLWMGALTLNYQRTEELVVTQVALSGNTATFYVTNKGTSDVTITRIQASGAGIPSTNSAFIPTGTSTVIKATSTTLTITVTFTGGQTAFSTGYRYDFVLVSSQAHMFPVTATA